MSVGWGTILVLVGCQRVLGLSLVQMIDAPPPPPDAPPCVMPELYDTFDGPGVCSSWGFVDQSNATVDVENGQLVIQPEPNVVTTRGGCLSLGSMAFTADSGVFAQVPSPPDGEEYMQMQVQWTGSDTITTVGWNPGTIHYQRADGSGVEAQASTPFTPNSSWVRLRPSADATAVVVETSPDGLAWTPFETDLVTPPAQVRPSFENGTFAADPDPAPIKYDGFDACP